MSDTKKLTAQLKLAKAQDVLEEAREAMHADRNPETISVYQAASNKVAGLRSAIRTDFPRDTPAEADGVAEVDTIEVKAGVKE